jgi:hypothetical protein
MSIDVLKADNLVKLLDGLFSLDNQDQERIISIVDALDFSIMKTEKAIFADTSPSEEVNLIYRSLL